MMEIVTNRLILNSLKNEDAEEYFNIRSHTEYNKYQGWIPSTLEEVIEFINKMKGREFDVNGTWFQFAIRLKSTDQIVGDVGVHFLEKEPRSCEIGVTISSRYFRRGIASEALQSIISVLFDRYAKNKIIASIDPRNDPSIRLMQALGFKKVAHYKKRFLLRGEYVDDAIYQLCNTTK